MYLPKSDIYNTLKALESDTQIAGLKVYQSHPEKFNSLPIVTFTITNNTINTFLDNSIASQDIDVQVDIWGSTQKQCGEILSKVEEKMRASLYRMTYSADIPNLDGKVKHIICRFNARV